MKYIFITLLILIIAGFIVGYYIVGQGNPIGEVIIGIDVLVVAFVLMPLFLYHRYKNKDLANFKFKGFQQPEEEKKEEEQN